MDKVKGVWFLNDHTNNDDTLLKGELYTDSNGYFILELYGDFKNIIDGESDITIYGNSVDGEFLTLKGCIRANYNFHSNAIINMSMYFVQSVFITKNPTKYSFIGDLNTQIIDNISFKTYNLNSWKWNNNFKFEGFDSIKPGDKYRMEYVIPKREDKIKLNNINFRFNVKTKLPSYSIDVSERTVSEDTYIDLSGQNLTIHELNKYMYMIVDFLSLVIGVTQVPTNVSVTVDNVKFDYYFLSSRKKVTKEILTPNMLLTYRDINNEFYNVLSKWIKHYENYKDIYQLYFSTGFKEVIFVNDRFLFYVQFLESIHRKFFPVEQQDMKSWKKQLDFLLSKISDFEEISKEDRRSIRERLAYGYEPSLKYRLEFLFSKYAHNSILNNEKSIEAIKNTRNYLTHYGKKQKDVIDDVLKLNEINNELEKIIKAVMLKTIGIDEQKINKMFKGRTIVSQKK